MKKSKGPSKGSLPEPLPLPEVKPGWPALEGCALELDWRDFKGLLEAKAAARESVDAPRSPVSYVVGVMAARGKVEARCARLEAEAELRVVEEGWTWVPLIQGEVALWEVQLDGERVVLVERGGTRGVLVEGPRAGRLSLRFDVKLEVEAAHSAVAFGLPAAPVLQLELEVPGERELDLVVQPAVHQVLRREGGGTRVEAAVPGPRSVRVSWTVAREEGAAEDPIVQAEVESLALVGDGNLRLKTRVVAEVLRAPVRRLHVQAPPGLTVTDVQTRHLGQWEVNEAGRVEVVLERGVEGALELEIDGERSLDEAGRASLGVVELEEAVRNQGVLALVPLTNVDLECGEVQGVRRIDPQEVTGELRRRAPKAILHAFQYSGTEPRLEVTAVAHPDLPVISTAVLRAEYVVQVTEDGKRFCQASFEVCNTERQFLRVRLAGGDRLLSALLADEPVKPAQEDAEHVLVPLRRGGSPEDAERSFRVDLVSLATVEPQGDRGEIEIQLPGLDLPIAYLTCVLHLPAGYVYDDFEGDLPEVVEFRDPLVTREAFVQRIRAAESARRPARGGARAARPAPRMAPPRAMAQMAAPPVQQAEAMFDCLEEEQAEENADYGNDPFGGVGGDPFAMGNVGGGGDPFAQLSEALPEEGGRLPIRLDIPKQGQRFQFETLLVLGESLRVRTEYTRERV